MDLHHHHPQQQIPPHAMHRYPSTGSLASGTAVPSTSTGADAGPSMSNAAAAGPRRSIDVDALASGVQRFLPSNPSGGSGMVSVPSAASSSSASQPSSRPALSHPSMHPHSHSHLHSSHGHVNGHNLNHHAHARAHPHSLHPHHPHHQHQHQHQQQQRLALSHSHPSFPHPLSHPHTLSSTPHAHTHAHSPFSHPSSASIGAPPSSAPSAAATAYIALPHGLDPSTVDFRTFYPYNPAEVKHRKRTTRTQLKLLEETFRRETKPNAALRKTLASQLEMTPRGVQVWFQNRRAKEKALAKKATAGGDKKPNVNLGKDKDGANDDGDADNDDNDNDNADADDVEVELDGEDVDLDERDEEEAEELAPQAKANVKVRKLDGGEQGEKKPGCNSGSPSSSLSSANGSTSPDQTPPPTRLPLAVEIPQAPPVGVRIVAPATNGDEEKAGGSPKRVSPTGTRISRGSWSGSSDGGSNGSGGQQQQHPSSATLPPTRTTPTPNLPSMEDETLLSLRRPSLPTHLHTHSQGHSSLSGAGAGGPPNAFRNPRAMRGLGSFSGASVGYSGSGNGGFHPLAGSFDPAQRRMSLDRLAHHPYAHLAAQANGVVFGGRYRPGSALSGAAAGNGRLPIGPTKSSNGLTAMSVSPSPNLGVTPLQTIRSGGNTPTHTPQPRRTELPPNGVHDEASMGMGMGMDIVDGVPPDHVLSQQQGYPTPLHITRPELMHRASLPAQAGVMFRNPFDSMGAPVSNDASSNAGTEGTSAAEDGSASAMQGIQTTTANPGLSRGPLSASVIASSSSSPPVQGQTPFGTPSFMASHHSLNGLPNTGAYTLQAQQQQQQSMTMRFPREGHSYVLSARSYQPPLAGPLPNPDFQFGTSTGSSGSGSGSGSDGESVGGASPESGSGPGAGHGANPNRTVDEGLNAQLQQYQFPPSSDQAGESDHSSVARNDGQGDMYEMHDLSASSHSVPHPSQPMYGQPHPESYNFTRYNSVVSVADSEASVASCYSAAPSEVGSYDIVRAVHGHGQMHGHVFDERRPSCTGQVVDMFSNMGMQNGSNLSLTHQHAQQQQPMEGITSQSQAQDSPMANAQPSPDNALGVNYASPGSSGGSSDIAQQQNQSQVPVISQSSELAFALQPDNPLMHRNSTVADSAGDLSAAQHAQHFSGANATRPRDSVDASSLATSHRTSSDISSLMYPLSNASACSSTSSLGFHQPPLGLNVGHRSTPSRIGAHSHSSDLQFGKPQQPQLDMDFLHNYDDVSETGHYSPISQPLNAFDFSTVETGSLGFAPGPYDTHTQMGHTQTNQQPQHTQLMEHGNGSFVGGQQVMYGAANDDRQQFVKMQHHQHSQDSLAFRMQAMGQSTDSFGYYR